MDTLKAIVLVLLISLVLLIFPQASASSQNATCQKHGADPKCYATTNEKECPDSAEFLTSTYHGNLYILCCCPCKDGEFTQSKYEGHCWPQESSTTGTNTSTLPQQPHTSSPFMTKLLTTSVSLTESAAENRSRYTTIIVQTDKPERSDVPTAAGNKASVEWWEANLIPIIFILTFFTLSLVVGCVLALCYCESHKQCCWQNCEMPKDVRANGGPRNGTTRITSHTGESSTSSENYRMAAIPTLQFEERVPFVSSEV